MHLYDVYKFKYTNKIVPTMLYYVKTQTIILLILTSKSNTGQTESFIDRSKEILKKKYTNAASYDGMSNDFVYEYYSFADYTIFPTDNNILEFMKKIDNKLNENNSTNKLSGKSMKSKSEQTSMAFLAQVNAIEISSVFPYPGQYDLTTESRSNTIKDLCEDMVAEWSMIMFETTNYYIITVQFYKIYEKYAESMICIEDEDYYRELHKLKTSEKLKYIDKALTKYNQLESTADTFFVDFISTYCEFYIKLFLFYAYHKKCNSENIEMTKNTTNQIKYLLSCFIYPTKIGKISKVFNIFDNKTNDRNEINTYFLIKKKNASVEELCDLLKDKRSKCKKIKTS